MINLKEVFHRITNRRWNYVSAENSKETVKTISRDTKPKTSHKMVAQSFVQPETSQSRRQLAYHKRKRTLHSWNRRKNGFSNKRIGSTKRR